VATGKTTKLTPEGSFYIREKIKNRPYYKEKIKGGDPKNPLGDRWLGISAKENGTFPYAIHGNNNENTIGKYVSAGCIRMHNKEVRELYDKIQVKTKVVITTSTKDFAVLAQPHMKLVAKK
jgi:lipoprotein-anchoring transpeptidase ErfK/SrfK